MASPLEVVREQALSAGLDEAICSNCGLFDAAPGADMGKCRRRDGDVQFRYGICVGWTVSHILPPRPKPASVRLEDGSLLLFGRAEVPLDDGPPPGAVDGLTCAEPGCGGCLRIRRSYRLNKWFYGCEKYPTCNGTLPANEDGAPRGVPRGKKLQAARVAAHDVFDRLWKDKHCTRKSAYAWLRELLRFDAHIGEMDSDQCEEVVAMVAEHGPGSSYWVRWFERHSIALSVKRASRPRKPRKRKR
jgi:hypothetical protein